MVGQDQNIYSVFNKPRFVKETSNYENYFSQGLVLPEDWQFKPKASLKKRMLSLNHENSRIGRQHSFHKY